MPRVTRWLTVVAALAVLGVFAFPLWRVTLEAPQYPEGIGMQIHVDGVTGVKEHDLDNINGLNHYIGMARIEPESIPELRYMPWIAAAIVLTGLVVAWRGSRAVYVGWASLVLSTFALGVYDFWKWEYNYGHNLNPDAAIRIPGLSYQPPLFGSKPILNFVAHSYPDIGGWMLIGAGVLIGAILAYLLFVPRARGSHAPPSPRALAAVVTAVLLLVVSCADPAPRALALGTDECAQCRMMITDPRFGAQVIMRTGKIQTFDAIECVAAFVASADSTRLRSVWVTDFERPGTWIRASEALYVADASRASPMGRSLLALNGATDSTAARARYGGHVRNRHALVQGARLSLSTGHTHAVDSDAP